MGRPSLVEHVEFLRTSGYTWEEVSSVLGVSRSTVWRRLKDSNVHIDKYTDISDSQLDIVVSQVQQQHPNVGQVMLQGFLKVTKKCGCTKISNKRKHNYTQNRPLTEIS